MIFADKQVKAMRKLGVMPEIFVLESRTNPALLRRESGRFQQCIASCRPDLIHAQYGTVTACLADIAKFGDNARFRLELALEPAQGTRPAVASIAGSSLLVVDPVARTCERTAQIAAGWGLAVRSAAADVNGVNAAAGLYIDQEIE